MDRISPAAQAIAAARLSRTPLDVLPETIRPRDEAEAYRTQDAVHALLTHTSVGPLVGYKIGCTTPVMQRYLGIPAPCAGGLFQRGVHGSGVKLAYSDFVRIGIECEIAVRLEQDLLPPDLPFSPEVVSRSVGSYMAAVEIVDDRYRNWRQTDTPTLIADDFFSAGCVLGIPYGRTAVPELSDVVGRTFINGAQVGHGVGSDVLGHPHNALAWLATHLAIRGGGLRAGHVVLTGSLVQTVWLKPGDEVMVTVSGLGAVSLAIPRD